MSRLALAVALLAVWILLWGDLSVPNVLSGLAVVGLLFVVFPSSRPILPTLRVRPIALARLVVHFLVNLVGSNIVLSRTIVSPRARVVTGVVKVHLRTDDMGLLAMITNITALTPGSMVVDLDLSGPRPVAWVHVLTPGDPMQMARNMERLEELCVRAVGSPEQIAKLERGRSR